jgi:uncharacterized protein (DUF2267 family)
MIGTISNLENSIHKTNEWINEIKEELNWQDETTTYTVLEGTLQLIRDMLTVEEATDFGSQLPLVLRGTYYSNWDPSKTPKTMKRSDFVSKVHAHLGNNPDIEPNSTVRKILHIIDKKISEGEISDVKAQLPDEIKKYWEE